MFPYLFWALLHIELALPYIQKTLCIIQCN